MIGSADSAHKGPVRQRVTECPVLGRSSPDRRPALRRTAVSMRSARAMLKALIAGAGTPEELRSATRSPSRSQWPEENPNPIYVGSAHAPVEGAPAAHEKPPVVVPGCGAGTVSRSAAEWCH